jgi:hypothetical protein
MKARTAGEAARTLAQAADAFNRQARDPFPIDLLGDLLYCRPKGDKAR